MNETVFGLIRHSVTLWNEEKRIQGLRNSPLSETGAAMARRWGEQLQAIPFARIVSSDLGRARQTADLINATLALPREEDPRLREQDWGQWSGLTLPQLYKHHGEAVRRQEEAGWDFLPPGGESRRAVLARSREALLEHAGNRPGETILVVTHEGVLKCLLYDLLGRKFLPREPRLLTGYHLHLLRSDGRSLWLDSLNHLSLHDDRP